ncbi:MAG: protein kinase [Acidobacteriota bacterium]
MIGQTIAHYRITEKLGGGGMGVVYLAEDMRLDRRVAIKFLPPDFFGDSVAERRFEQEAKAAAALSHPHICTVHDVGQHEGRPYLVMEFLHGQTLKHRLMERKRLTIEEILDLGIQIASGLEQAHARGIVHRDIKPANIFITVDDYAKILDFGLAKRIAEEPAGDPNTKTAVLRESLTDPGTVLGTVAYMSPEQVRGEVLDVRSDLFSLGIVLYEMATGQLPFQGSSAGVVMSEILNRSPVPAIERRSELPRDLDFLIRKALEKNPVWRCQSATQVLADLRRIQRETISDSQRRSGKAHSEELPSIAVLPFQNLSADPENEYFGDGLAEELINALAKLKRLRVAARSSAFGTKGKGQTVAEVGRELRVETVLEGSVRAFRDRIRVTAQLVSVANGSPLWSERFDRQLDDIFAIQDEICTAIVDNLRVKLLSNEEKKLVEPHKVDQEAYRLYLKGRYFWNRRHSGGMEKALAAFQQATEVDPLYAEPYVGVADVYNIMANFGFMAPREACPKARAAAEKALELNERSGEAHISLAWNKMHWGWDWAGAEMHYRLGLELSPDYGTGHEWYALFLVNQHRFEEALTHINRALELDPLSPVFLMAAGLIHTFATDLDTGDEMFRRSLELDPRFASAHLFRGWMLSLHGRFEESIRSLNEAIGILGRQTIALGFLGWALAGNGQTEEALEILEEIEAKLQKEGPSDGFFKALIELGLGRTDDALDSLEAAVEVCGTHLWALGFYGPSPSIRFANPLAPLRGEVRFQQIVERIDLPFLVL